MQRHHAFRFVPFLAAVVAAMACPSLAAAAQGAVSSASAGDLPAVARSLAPAASLRVEAVTLDGVADAKALDLKRFDVVTPGARFVVQGADGPADAHPALPVWLRGTVEGETGSVAMLSVRASGEVRGVVSTRAGTWMLHRDASAARAADPAMRSRRVDPGAIARSRPLSCETVDNPMPRRTGAKASSTVQGTGTQRSTRLPIAYTAQIAVELDYEFYVTFAPDTDAAILYALDLMAFTGVLGESELGMNVQVPFVQLWTTVYDPYSQGSNRLGQLRARWNEAGSTNCGGSDCTAIDRSTVILLSSASTGGVAYVPGLCDSWHSPTGGYSYAYAGSIDGDFDVDSPEAVWDIVVTTHELGHNFGSHHTHCYDPPVDGCYNGEDGCYAGTEGLPSGCPGSDQGCGTIMSYCHLLAGGEGNISLTYGAGHPYGTDPGRVPSAMISRAAIEAAEAPGCLAPTDGMARLEVTVNGTGSGTVTSLPSGIDCPNGCRTWVDADTVVTLTATPGAFSQFTGWSGDADCNDGVVTVATAVSCTATFDGTCGPGNEDCDDNDPCTLDSCPGDASCQNTAAPRDPLTCLASGKSVLRIKNDADPSRDKLTWAWGGGDAFAQGDIGNPALGTDLRLCIFDATAGSTSLAASIELPAGSPLWRDSDPRGWSYRDSQGVVDGVKKFQFKTGVAGKARVKLSAAGAALPLPAPFSGSEMLDADPSVVAQLFSSDGTCWSTTFPAAGVGANTPASFSAAGD